MLKLLNALGITLLTLLFIILTVYLWIIIETKLRLKNYPEIFSYKFYLVKENANLKDINIDDLIIINENANIDNGDIVLYLNTDGTYELARVDKINSVSVLLKKDGSFKTNTMNSSVIVGKASKRVRGFGNILHILKNKIFLLTIGIIGFISIVYVQKRQAKPKQIA